MRKVIGKSVAVIIIIYVLFIIDGIYKNKPLMDNGQVGDIEHEVVKNDSQDNDGIITYDKYYLKLKRIRGYDAKIIENFEEKLSTLTVKTDNSCDVITNAGFFNTERNPIGLIAIEGETLSLYESNAIFNAFVCYIGADNWLINISNKDQLLCKFIFQSGPLLVYQFDDQDLSSNTSDGRRLVFILDEKDTPYILVAYDSNDYFNGPDFSTMLTILSYLEGSEEIKIKSAINLDGGTASSYIDSNYEINELIPPGAFLCFNEIN